MAVRKKFQTAEKSSKHIGEVGEVRRSQLVTTYGIGSMLAAGEQSYVVSGLDSWPQPQPDEPFLREFRLETRLRAPRGFRLPPDGENGDGVRARLFPEWYSCPGVDPKTGQGCENNLRERKNFAPPAGKNTCSACSEPLTPSRFVVACENGHLDDFPYWRWVHAGADCPDSPKSRLRLSTTGRTSALRSILIGCSCGESASMEGAMGRQAMQAIRYRCRGRRPWLGRDAAEQGCDRPARVLQRGSSSVWLPVIASALSIPPFSQTLYAALLPHYEWFKDTSDDEKAFAAKRIRTVEPRLLRYTSEEIIEAAKAYADFEAGHAADPSTLSGFEAADVLREQEFEQLSRPSTPDPDDLDQIFECVPPEGNDQAAPPSGIEQVMLVNRLREVRVLKSFTRIEALSPAEDRSREAKLSLQELPWLPGFEVSGEGVFLRLNDDRLRAWAEQTAPGSRARRIRDRHQELLTRRTPPGKDAPKSQVTARFVLVHTLAHALINEWSLEAGYPASSMRERLFVSDTTAGLLIYTATSDAAGSLGGLVELGQLRNIRRTFDALLERQRWCSADPLCMEADAAGADSLNLAACHSCLLLPEVSCENGNSFLDRAMVVGGGTEEVPAYFA
ncbi:DUF1998 domain-containing protein [Kineosporia sp. NBRC 101731]|uniref:DUF1998 domain-containing protein n=1 Tax=Kineosporia sp. NBRC 101731 TaxID=3032199 RepID=UPI0024A50043|nr:DUF1998 domain-containing protein [Kineosporia sp. NBRC 101731]GLY31589.1 hypothetical protein Kisp02_49540 [Kineosporia sp. NBRC 101731]